jgi:hypothetical protein
MVVKEVVMVMAAHPAMPHLAKTHTHLASTQTHADRTEVTHIWLIPIPRLANNQTHADSQEQATQYPT